MSSGKSMDVTCETHLGYLCNILTFDQAQKCYSKVMHRKEVTHSNGQ